MGDNPLIAQPQDSSSWYTGIGIVEAIADVSTAIESGSWAEIGYAVLGTGLEVLSAVLDPIGTGVSWLVGWLIEFVQPLTDMLDWLAGNADAIAAHAQTWRNVGESLRTTADALQADVVRDTAGWTGAAADAYRARLTATAELIRAQSQAAGALAEGTEIAGMLVGTIREVVRDLIADCVGRLVSWAIEAATGVGIAAVAVQASARVARWAVRIMGVIQKLLRALGDLVPLLRKLADLLGQLRKILADITHGKPLPQPPEKPPNTPNDPNTPRNPNDPPNDPPDDDIGPVDNPEDRQRLIEEALAQGHKISPDKVVEIGKDPNGRIVWLEEGKGGKGGAGLEHVYEHEKEFTDRGIPREEIGKFVHEVATEGKYTGYSQGKPPGRPIFEIEYGGQRHFVALTIGSNGFIVGANMKSSKNPFENAWRPAEADNPAYRGW